jgi:hypothetical protein
MTENEGFGVTRRTPRHLVEVALQAPYPGSNARTMDRGTGQGVLLNRLSPSIRVTIVLAAMAAAVAGCADSRLAANNAANQSEQPYSAGYGLSSAGTTTDLYTEFFGSSRRDDKNAAQVAATASASPPQVQPVTAAAPQPVQPATASAPTKRGQPATASAPTRLVQPAPAATEVAQPAAPQAPPEPDVPVAYGITANGPTTDLYTELFGPRRRDGQ